MPITTFGPWTTSLDAGSQLELSAFWRSRLARLSHTAAVRERTSMYRAALLGCAILILAAAPTWHAAALSDQANPDKATTSTETTTNPAILANDAARRNAEKVLAALDLPTEASFVDLALVDAFRYMQDYHNISIRFDTEAIKAVGRSLDNATTSLQVSGILFRSVLKLILEPEALGFFVEGGEMVITSRGNAWLTETDYDIRPLVRAGIRPAELAAAIPFLIAPSSWETAGGQGELEVDEQVLKATQRREVHQSLRNLLDSVRQTIRQVPGSLDDLPGSVKRYSIADFRQPGVDDLQLIGWFQLALFQALRLDRHFSDRNELTYQLTGDELVVTNQTDWGHLVTVAFLNELRALRRNGPARSLSFKDFARAAQGTGDDARRRALLRELQRRITVNFDNAPFKDVLKTLATEGKFNLVLNPDALQPGKLADATPVTLRAQEETCSTVLDRLCSQLGLVWNIGDEVVKVTTDDVSNPRRVPHAYSTRGLLVGGRTERAVAEAIMKQIEPQTWGSEPGKARLFALPGVIVVMHNEAVQRRIERWLQLQHQQ